MAFPWEVEALRKMIQATIAGTAAEHNILQDAAKEERDIWEEERFGEYPEPDDVAPEDWFGGYRERQEQAEEMSPWEGIPFQEYYEGLRAEEEWQQDMLDTMRDDYIEEKQDKLKLDWVNEILKEHAEKVKPDVIHLGDETARERQKDWTIHSAPDDAIQDYLDMAREAEDEDEYWKEYDRLERGIGVSPEVPPFLSYLLRQSPYARLPAAGLLGLGLMGYSKPAY